MGSPLYSINVISGGSGYSPGAYIVITDPTGGGASAVPSIAGGVITGVSGFVPGANYSSPTVTVVDPATGGTGATFGITLGDATNGPATVCYYQQRRVFGGSNIQPSGLWMTRSGNSYNFNTSQPVRADDGIVYRLASTQNNAIRHLVPLQDLIALTASGIWKISGDSNNGVITPMSVQATPQAAGGASHVTPLLIGYDLLYVQERGVTVSSVTFSWQSNSYQASDLNLSARHLFTGYQVKEWAFAREPYKVIWTVRNDGLLLGCTYLREQEVIAWHRHDTKGGAFQSVATVGEGTEDVPYFVVQRTIGGRTVQCIERMASRQLGAANDDITAAWFVDCGLQYRGAPASHISGLDHLEGEAVSVLADGGVVEGLTVRGGAIDLPAPARVVTVGLPIQAQLETLPLEFQGQQTVQGARKHVSKVWALVEKTRGLKAGVVDPFKGPMLVEFKERRTEAWGQPTGMLTGKEQVHAYGTWNTDCTVMFQQDYPLPAAVLGVLLEAEVGT